METLEYVNMNAKEIIDQLQLKKHPEGGYFKEVYRSAGTIPNSALTNDFEGDRNYSTSIYFLLTSEHFSAFHKINQDEIWHFYKGDCLRLHVITQQGEHQVVNIGNNLDKDETLQYVVNAGDWFAAEIPKKDGFALVGCTVSPGFDFKDFTMPTRKELIDVFPEHKKLISRLTHY